VDNISEQLVRRDRLRAHLAQQKTPEQRMADMARLQETMWATLRKSPEGYAHFMRRNFKARAINVRKLAMEIASRFGPAQGSD
jgi:hypothetical protein